MWTQPPKPDPWVYVALPGQEIEYFQMQVPRAKKTAKPLWQRIAHVYRLLTSLGFL